MNTQQTGHPTVARRMLSIYLRQTREKRKLTLSDLGPMLDGSARARVGHWETMLAVPRPEALRALLTIYEIDPDEIEEWVTVAKLAGQRGQQRLPAAADLPKWFPPLVRLESAAAKLSIYAPAVIPGLVQTEPFARAVIEDMSVHPLSLDVIAQRAQVRMARQQLLHRPAAERPTVTILLEQSALCRIVGDRRIMADQLRRLAELIRSQTITLNILPHDDTVHPASASPEFMILEFDHRLPVHDPGIVYSETRWSGGDLLDNPTAVEETKLIFAQVSARSVGAAPSLSIIEQRAEELEQ